MVCPNCNKNITINKSNIREEDGGVIIELKCNACHKTFETFNIPDDFEEVFDVN